VERLRRELKIGPSEETWRLAEKIRNRHRVHSLRSSADLPLRQSRRPGLVGRDRELDTLIRVWRTTRAGAGGVVVVHGEPGIGKTRLATELRDTAIDQGALTAMGTTTGFGGAPFCPWAELSNDVLRGLGGAADGAPFLATIAALIPTAGRSPTPGQPQFEQARITEGLLDLVEFAASRAPLLLIFEDMHSCDEASAVALGRACRRLHDLPVLLLLTRRDRPTPPALAEAEQGASNSGLMRAQIHLQHFGDEAISRIARDAGQLDDDAVRSVVAVADGNALLAVEAARTIARGDALPHGLRSTVRAAGAHISAQSKHLCAVLAVAGRPLRIEDLRRRFEPCDDDTFYGTVQSAQDAGLLTIADGAVGFEHALLRDAYYAEIPDVQRVRLHTGAATDLTENAAPELAGEAARHLLAAGDKDGAATLLVRAAEHAFSLGALARAEESLVEAAQIQPSNVDIILDLARVAAHRGLPANAQTRFEHALNALRAVGDPTAVASAHINWAEWNTGPLCRPSVALASVRSALDALDTAGVSALQLRIQAQAFMALCEAMAGDPARCDALLEGLDIQCRPLPPDPVRDIRRHLAKSIARIRQGRFDEVAETGRAAAGIARSIGRQDLVYGSLVNAAAALAATNEYAGALQVLEEVGSVPSQGSLALATEAEVQMSRAWLLSRLGRHSEAGRVAESARRIANRIGATELLAMADAEAGRISLRARCYEEAAALLERALRVPGASIGRPMARLQRAEALARSGHLDAANDELSATALEPVRPGDWPDTLVARMSSVRGLIAAAKGDVARARHHLQHAASCWRRRVEATDAGERYAIVLADLGRPIVGLVSPGEELETVLNDLDQLQGRCDAPLR
ncbi:MAG: hypothetical protein QOH57_1806, partial [Mycobacterium sp.]|nr:hypothetical protein [Mycobacterium sp.]